MEVHANASLTPQGRLTMVRRPEYENWTLARQVEQRLVQSVAWFHTGRYQRQ